MPAPRSTKPIRCPIFSPHHADVRRGGVTWLARRAAPGRPVVNRDEVARTRGLFLSFLFGAKKKII